MMIIPAILTQDVEEAIEQISGFDGVAPCVQIDVMDGTMTDHKTFLLDDFVDVISYGGDIEMHLMTADPISYLEHAKALGAARVYFHLGVNDPRTVLDAMDRYDFSRGICLSPEDEVSDLFTYIDEIDAVQIMTVHPGQQGAQFLPEQLQKVADVRERRTDLWISVDGGVNLSTIDIVAQSSLDGIGVGSALSRAEDPVDAFMQLQSRLR